MVAEECLRLAWEADRQGRRKFRDSLLTLAIIESGPNDSWSERCRARLLADRTGHYLGDFPSVRAALADPRVIEARDRLRVKYPRPKVAGLLLIAQASRGTYTGRVEALEAILEDLVRPAAEAENVRRDAPQVARGPMVALSRSGRPVLSSLAFATTPRWEDPDAPSVEESGGHREMDHFYQSVLFAIAVLVKTSATGTDSRRG